MGLYNFTTIGSLMFCDDVCQGKYMELTNQNHFEKMVFLVIQWQLKHVVYVSLSS